MNDEYIKSLIILIVDDSPTIVMAFSKLLAAEGYITATATSGKAAIEAARNLRPACILLDYFLPDMTGEEILGEIRRTDFATQVVLVTAHAQERPPLQMMNILDIQGFHDKRDSLDKLLVWVSAALKAYVRNAALHARSNAMQKILQLGQRIHRVQPLNMLLGLALDEVLGLLGSEHGLVLSGEHTMTIAFRKGTTNKLIHDDRLSARAEALVHKAQSQSQSQEILLHEDGLVALSLRPAGRFCGCVLVEHNDTDGLPIPQDELKILGHHLSLAIENNRLHEIATTDPLTGLSSRGHVMQRLRECIQSSLQHRQPLSVILIDLDKFKSVNDTYGHRAGDAVLERVGHRILRTVRNVDIAGRQGGDEFMVIAPDTDWRSAQALADRLQKRLSALQSKADNNTIDVSASVGCGGFGPMDIPDLRAKKLSPIFWDEVSASLLEWVDAAAYKAKLGGGNRSEAATNGGDLTALMESKIKELLALQA